MIHPVLRRPAHRIASSITAREGRLSAATVIAALLTLAACADPTEPAEARLITRVRLAPIKIGVGGGFDGAGNVGDIPNTEWHPQEWRFIPAFGDFAANQVQNCTLYGRCNAGTLAGSLGTLGLAPNSDPNPGPGPNGESTLFGYMTTTSFVENAQTIAVRASAIEDDLSLESSTELTGKGRYQLNFDYAFLTNTQAPSAGASPFAEFQLLWDQNQSAPQLPYERSDEIFRISRSDLLANPSLQQAGGCGQGGIGNAVYSLCTGWRNQTVDIPDFYNGQRFVLRLLLQDGGATFSDTDPVTRLIPDNGYASVIALDNFKLVGLPVITGSTQTPDGPVAINTLFSLLVTYDYADPAATHTAAIDWTDGTQETPTTTQANGSGSFPSGSHLFTAAGLYMVLAIVRDNSNNADTTEIPVAVYDPSVGFATGAGWFLSPPGAYLADPSLTDKAHFAFISKIDKKTAGLVNGNANFRFQAADLTFDGTSYDWLKVAGPKAMMKGSGTVNDVPGFGFLISAVDGQISGGGGIDKFRIKIWDKNNGNAVVYDNQLGVDENADPTTTLGGGSITIKK